MQQSEGGIIIGLVGCALLGPLSVGCLAALTVSLVLVTATEAY